MHIKAAPVKEDRLFQVKKQDSAFLEQRGLAAEAEGDAIKAHTPSTAAAAAAAEASPFATAQVEPVSEAESQAATAEGLPHDYRLGPLKACLRRGAAAKPGGAQRHGQASGRSPHWYELYCDIYLYP